MGVKRRLRVESRSCLATGMPTHAASRRRVTPYCEQHFIEYQAHRKRYNDMKYNYAHGRSSVQPPEPIAYWASVSWSELQPLYVQIDDERRERIENAFNEVNLLHRILKKNPLAPSRTRRKQLADLSEAIAILGWALREANLISVPIPDPRESRMFLRRTYLRQLAEEGREYTGPDYESWFPG